jgi:hypothetical protein
MALKISEVVSILLLVIVGGLYWGPGIALTRTVPTCSSEVLLVIVKRMNRNMARFAAWCPGIRKIRILLAVRGEAANLPFIRTPTHAD